MCGRYRLSRRKQFIADHFDGQRRRRLGAALQHRPTQPVPIAVTGLVCMIASRANVHLLVWWTHSNAIKIAERRVVDFVHGFVSEAHLQNDSGAARYHSIIYPASEVISEYKFVSIWLVGIDHIRSRSRTERSALSACLISFYKIVKGVVVEFGDRNLLETVSWMNIQGRTSTDIPILDIKGERHGFRNLARKVGIRWSYPSPRTGNQ